VYSEPKHSYSFFDLAEFFELLTECTVVGVPCKATGDDLDADACVMIKFRETYPIKSFDMV